MAKLKKPTVKNPQLVEALAELKEHSTQGAVKNLMEALKGAQLIAPVIIDNMPVFSGIYRLAGSIEVEK